MLHCQEVFLKLKKKNLIKEGNLEGEKINFLPKMLFIKIFCYLKIKYCTFYLCVTHKHNMLLFYLIRHLLNKHFVIIY